MEIDKGYVNADSTWHKLPQYVCIPDRAITIMEAMEVASYPLEKFQLHYVNGDQYIPVDGYAIIRTDTMTPVVDHVGARFSVQDNSYMVGYINENLLAAYPDLKIESVGTLWGGATFFLNLRVYERQVKGDSSGTITNLMYANPLGRGSYVACAHNTRIVCNNTSQVAQAQGLANESLKKFRHTSSAAQRINDHLIDMAKLKLELEQHYDRLDFMATQTVNGDDIRAFLDEVMPLPTEKGRAQSMAQNNRDEFLRVLYGAQSETLDNPRSKYALFQAYTDWLDHESTSRNADEAAIMWDGIIGNRNEKKQKALLSLVA
jgi:phage/plasmid-like protein (TIGR03299 family)